MKKNIINRSALRRAFKEQTEIWQSPRRNMPRNLIEACETAVALQVARFAAEGKKNK